ncbi:MAG TPA: hypothetical protein VK619_02950 [Pyrinomonadaceae bacterium]|nr:hypothetical protein [Pyrinomonadaceae bacterium]
MRYSKQISALSLLIFATFFLTACPQRESIGKINADPSRYYHKEIGVAGTVTDSYGFMGMGIYQIDDGTGHLLVVTQRGVPSRGARVAAKGHLQTGFSVGGRNFGTVLEETDRRAVGR